MGRQMKQSDVKQIDIVCHCTALALDQATTRLCTLIVRLQEEFISLSSCGSEEEQSVAACILQPTLIFCCSKFFIREELTSLSFGLQHLAHWMVIQDVRSSPMHVTVFHPSLGVTCRHGCTVKKLKGRPVYSGLISAKPRHHNGRTQWE